MAKNLIIDPSARKARTKTVKSGKGGMEWNAQMAAGRSAGMTDLEAELIGIAEAPMLGGIQERALSHRKDLDRAKTGTSVGGGGMNAEQRALYDAMMRAGDKLDGTLQVKVVGPVTMYSPTIPGDGGQ